MHSSVAVVLSDMRPFLVATALQLKHEFPNCRLVTAETYVEIPDYGDTFPVRLRRLLAKILEKFAGLEVLSAHSLTNVEFSFLGPMSSLVSITNDSRAEPYKYPDLWNRLEVLSATASKLAATLASQGVTHILFFNGRVASTRELGLQFGRDGSKIATAYEWGGVPHSYRLFSYPLHDEEKFGENLAEFGSFREYQYEEARAAAWIRRKLESPWEQGATQSSERHYNTLVILGSPHEYLWSSDSQPGESNFANVPNHSEKTLYSTELAFLEEALSHPLSQPPIAIKCHPNMATDPSCEQQLREIQDFGLRNRVDVIPPTSHLSAVQLVLDSKVVIVGGSSVALDAYFLGREVVFIGVNRYRQIVGDVDALEISKEKKNLSLAGTVLDFDEHHSVRLSPRFFVIYYSLRVAEEIIAILHRARVLGRVIRKPAAHGHAVGTEE